MRNVFDDNELMDIFIGGLHEDIRSSVQHYWSTHRSIRMHALVAYEVSIDTTRGTRTRNLGTRGRKNNYPAGSARATGHLSTAAGLPEALLVSQNNVQYSTGTAQANRSSVDPSDPSAYFRFYLELQLSPTSHVTGECPHVAPGEAGRIKARREVNYPAYHNVLRVRYHRRCRTTGGRQSSNLSTRMTFTLTISSQKIQRVQLGGNPTPFHSVVRQSSDSACIVRRHDSEESRNQTHVDSAEPIKNVHKRVRFYESTGMHRLPMADADRTKRPSDHTVLHLCVSSPQEKRTMETQALEAKTTCTVEKELSFQTVVCYISDLLTHGTNESNANVRAEAPTGNTKYSTIAATDLSWEQQLLKGKTFNVI